MPYSSAVDCLVDDLRDGRIGRRQFLTHAAMLAAYEQPPLDESIAAELDEYVTRRKAELGD